MTTPGTAEMIWAAIEAGITGHGAPTSGTVRRRAPVGGDRNLYLAVHIPSGQRIVQLETSGVEEDIPVPPSTAAVVTTRVTGDHGTTITSLTLAEPAVTAVFSAFADDVINHIAATPDDPAATRALHQRHQHWRRLLSGKGAGLSPAAQQGLFGELWALVHLLSPAWGPAAAIRNWTGPTGAEQDFTADAIALEIKTVHRAARGFMVNGPHQLNDVHGDLVLIVIRVDESASGGICLNDLVDTARGLAPPAEQPLLEERFSDCRYHDADRAHYEHSRWTPVAVLGHRVTHGFPRLLPADLPDGIDDVDYTVDIAACAPWRLNPDQLRALLNP